MVANNPFICRVTEFLFSSLPKVPASDDSSDNDERSASDPYDDPTSCNIGVVYLSHEPSKSGASSNIIDNNTFTSCSNNNDTEHSESNTSSNSEALLSKVECPTCFKLFAINEISDHADLCADTWRGEVEHCHVLEMNQITQLKNKYQRYNSYQMKQSTKMVKTSKLC